MRATKKAHSKILLSTYHVIYLTIGRTSASARDEIIRSRRSHVAMDLYLSTFKIQMFMFISVEAPLSNFTQRVYETPGSSPTEASFIGNVDIDKVYYFYM